MLTLYFSGTGNTKYLAEIFSRKMRFACYSIEENADLGRLIASAKVVAFCYPIYGSRVPRPMRNFVARHLEALRGKRLIIFCTQAMFSGDGARAFADLLPKNHAKIIYAEHFTMPNNISHFYPPLQSPEKVAKIKRNMQSKLRKTIVNIRMGKMVLRGFNPVSQVLGMMQGSFWYSLETIGRRMVWIDDTKCVSCGLCAKICPTHNFEQKTGKPNPKGNCALCTRCMNHCPQKAIAILIPNFPKTQYNCNL
ncbi:MAG: EFR1 family ferrodoxin [Defluviitaleaceae bacterium]|nr:EFR1 family ferrodoxin [Defluviitaleaceae bacterium]